MTYSINERADQDPAFLAHEVGKLVDQTVRSKSIAGQISKHFSTQRPAVDFPLFTTPVLAGFIGELDDLPLSNVDTASVTATVYKIAGATQSSSEMLDDMDPDIAAQIGSSLSDQISWNLDSAVLGHTTVDGFGGLQSLAATVVDAGSLSNTDPFVQAVYAAQNAAVPAKVTHFVVSPATAQTLSLLKVQDGSNQSLLQFQQDGSILVAGVPILISSLVDAATAAWAVDASHNRLVLKAGTQVTKTYVPQNDSWFIGGVARYGWVNLAPASVIRISQDVSYTLTVTGGSSGSDHYTVKVNGVATADIAYNANAAAIKAAIVAVDDGITASDVTVTGSGPFTVTLPATLAHGTDAGATSTTVAVA